VARRICGRCLGSGVIYEDSDDDKDPTPKRVTCPRCNGSGYEEDNNDEENRWVL